VAVSDESTSRPISTLGYATALHWPGMRQTIGIMAGFSCLQSGWLCYSFALIWLLAP
jgi:hypothetical protein